MDKSKIEKLEDYLEGFLAVKHFGISPMGAVLIETSERDDVLNMVKKIEKFKIYDDMPEAGNGEIVINFTSLPSTQSANFLRAFVDGKDIATKILLILSKDLYDQSLDLQKLTSSVCRL